MDVKHKEKLRQNRLMLVRGMEVNAEMFSCLIENDIITDSMKENIEAEKTRMGQNGRLLDLLTRRGPNAYKSFILALVESAHKHIAEALDPEMYKKIMQDKEEKEKAELEQLPSATAQPTENEHLKNQSGTAQENSSFQGSPSAQSSMEESGGGKSQKPDEKEERMETGTPIQATDSDSQNVISSSGARPMDIESGDDAENLVVELTKEFEDWIMGDPKSDRKFCGTESMINQIEKLESSGKVKSGVCMLVSDEDLSIRDNVAYENIEHLATQLGFTTFYDKDAYMDNGSEAILRHMTQLNERLSTGRLTCDGLMIIVICRALGDLVDISRRHHVVKMCRDTFCALPALHDKPKMLMFQFIIERDPKGPGIDEVDALVAELPVVNETQNSNHESSNCAVLYLSTYHWREKTNLFSWVLVKAFLVCRRGASVQSVLKIIEKFLVRWKTTHIPSITLLSTLRDVSLLKTAENTA